MSERCAGCGNPLASRSGTWREATGWYQVRSRGANQITMRKDTGRVVCNGCMVARKSGVSRGQEGLL